MKALNREELRIFAVTDIGADYLMKRLPRGILGEIAVLKQMREMGFTAEIPGFHAKELDLIITRPNGTAAKVEIKSIAAGGGTFWVTRCPDTDAADYWIFVRGRNEFRILTTAEAAAVWRENPYNIGVEDGTGVTSSGTRKKGDIRWHQLAAYADAWDKLL